MMYDYEQYGIVFEQIATLVGTTGNVRMVQGTGYVSILCTFKYKCSEQVRIDNMFNGIRERVGDQARMKLMGDTENGKFAARITATWDARNGAEIER